jgi:phosphoribosylanthranilate isomerase
MTRVKICGITNLEDAWAAIQAGCDALGFAFFKRSPRYIPPAKAAGIIQKLPRQIIKIGVFVNAREKTIKRIARLCRLRLLQFHGRESADFCRRFAGYKIIKVFRLKDKIDLAKIKRYDTFAYLFDTLSSIAPGGTGKTFDWQTLRHLEDIRKPVFLAGGLDPQNVRRAIKLVEPDWVDVSSGVESSAGRKDRVKLINFVRQAKGFRGLQKED